jgi:predicted ABC-type ATPase
LRPSSEAPEFWIFAGPNGSGKSTAYSRVRTTGKGKPFWIVNPDLLTLDLVERENLPQFDANVAAVTRLEEWLKATIMVHRSLGVETVLSTDKYRKIVTLAKERGFAVNLFYVVLDSPQRNVERVRNRVESGGHDVPEQKIIERYWRSLQQMPWFLNQADNAWVYDNSGAELVLLAEKRKCVIYLHNGDAIPAVAEAVRSIG